MYTRVTTKGQVVIPVSLRKKYLLNAGTSVQIKEKNGAVVIEKAPTIEEVWKTLKPFPKKSITQKQMDQEIARGFEAGYWKSVENEQ